MAMNSWVDANADSIDSIVHERPPAAISSRPATVADIQEAALQQETDCKCPVFVHRLAWMPRPLHG